MWRYAVVFAVAAAVTFALTPAVWRFSTRWGAVVKPDERRIHEHPTPTLGGTAMLIALLVALGVARFLPGFGPMFESSELFGVAIAAIVILAIGMLDDLREVSAPAKVAGQVFAASILGLAGVVMFYFRVPFADFYVLSPDLGFLVTVLWVVAMANAVNLTDGLDGLAAGACVMIFGAYALINIWQYNQSCAYTASAGPKCYEVRDPYDLAVVAIALAGACFGFLWWNAEPAKIFMGDTGSLSLGGALAGMAIFTRTELLLLILGGLLVIEVGSVILQTSYFKLTRRIYGTPRRLFKMTPFHHHFELLNWAQVTIVMRFWIIAGLFVSAGLGIFYAEWVAGT